MRTKCIRIGVGLLALLAVAFGLAGMNMDMSLASAHPSTLGSPQAQPLIGAPYAPECGPYWSVVSSPNSSLSATHLYGVAAISVSDVWAVGAGTNGAQHWTLVEHWNGSGWSVWSSPNPGDFNNGLNGVMAVSASDVWAVGYYLNAHGAGNQTLVEHWNGAAWSAVASPSPGTSINALYGVAATSANNVWAVGYSSNFGSAEQTLVEHWDGSIWTVVSSPSVGKLSSVAAVSAGDVWAVGYANQTLIEHWDGTAWSVVPSPNVGTNSNTLSSVAAISAVDVWAVGYYLNGAENQTLVEHWNGTAWSVVPSPNVSTNSNTLYGVAAVTANDVWAVGVYDNGSVASTLGEHWNGSIWSIVASPNDGGGGELSSVAAISPSDVWAVGKYDNGSLVRPLAEHWDGAAWSVANSNDPNGGNLSSVAASAGDVWAVGVYNSDSVARTLIEKWSAGANAWVMYTSPNASTGDNALNGVAMLSTSDVWAVGEYSNGAVNQTLIEHRNGTAWSIIPSPNVGLYDNRLSSVAAISASDVWAVGNYALTNGGMLQTLAEHWDGSAWSVVASPNVGTSSNSLSGIAAVSASDVWAVGYYLNGTANQTLVEHWNGSAWSVVTSPNVGTGYNFLSGIAAVSASNVWAVGKYSSGAVNQTLMEQWNGITWSVVSSPNVGTTNNFLAGVAVVSAGDVWAVGNHDSATVLGGQTLVERYNPCTGTPTPTRTPITTPTRTPTACSISFSDVHTTDYFHDAVIYLACHGAISGYSDGTFRPYNNTTRGQVTKIVILGFGIPLNTTGGPHFSDVPTSNAFYAYVETANHSGIVSGYSDGTFRPGKNVTRGQLSKIVVVAAMQVNGWTLINPSTSTFTDVPPGSTFYQYVETAVSKGVISGYADHTFRPGNNATRGQIAKITYLAVTTAR